MHVCSDVAFTCAGLVQSPVKYPSSYVWQSPVGSANGRPRLASGKRDTCLRSLNDGKVTLLENAKYGIALAVAHCRVLCPTAIVYRKGTLRFPAHNKMTGRFTAYSPTIHRVLTRLRFWKARGNRLNCVHWERDNQLRVLSLLLLY